MTTNETNNKTLEEKMKNFLNRLNNLENLLESERNAHIENLHSGKAQMEMNELEITYYINAISSFQIKLYKIFPELKNRYKN